MSEERFLSASIEGKFDHFAPKDESIRITFDPVVPGKKTTKLSLVIEDTTGNLVHRRTWPSDKDGSKEPPTVFEWDGSNNVRGTAEKKKWVHPMGSPYVIRVLAELVDAPSQKKPKNITAHPMVLKCPPKPPPLESALESLVIKAGGATSKSYVLTDAFQGLRVRQDKQQRFCIAPGVDEKIALSWKIIKPAGVTRATLELFDTHSDVPLWKQEINDQKVLANGSLEAGKDFYQHLTAARSPFKLRMTITGANVQKRRHVAWTYVDVLVERIALAWGSARLIPSNAPEGVKDESFFKVEEVKVLRTLKNLAATDATGLDLLLAEDDKAAMVALNERERQIVLSSNAFYKKIDEWDAGFSFEAYKAFWGAGPRIPLVAEAFVRSAAGKEVKAPLAVKGLQLLWDWEDPKYDKKAGLTLDKDTGAYFDWAHKRENKDNGCCDDASPPSTNCHVRYGGKRGAGAIPIFPAQTGWNDGAVINGEFPFQVQRCPNRPWAALSTFYAGDEKNWQCKTGVLFQPSRMAGDTYRVRVYLHVEPGAFEAAVTGPEIWKQAAQAGLPRGAGPQVEIWRRLDIVSYLHKTHDKPFDVAEVNKKLAPAKVLIDEHVPDGAPAVVKMWDAGLKALWAEKAKDKNYTSLRAPLAENQTNHAFALKTKAWSGMANAAIRDALKALIQESSGWGNRAIRERLQKAQTALDLEENQPEWQRIAGLLPPMDLEHLEQKLKDCYPQNLNSEGVSVVSCRQNLERISAHLACRGAKGGLDDVLVPLLRWWLRNDGAASKDKRGLFVFHFESAFEAAVDVSGKACGFERGQGMFFFAYPKLAERLQIEATSGDKPCLVPLYLTTGFAEANAADFDAACLMLAHAALALVVDQIDISGAEPKCKETVKINVKCADDGAAGQVLTKLANFIKTPAFNKSAIEGHRERSIYLSLVTPFSRELCTKLFFTVSGGTELTDALKQSMREFARKTYDGVQHPIATVYIYYKDAQYGRMRADVVKEYLEGLFGKVRGGLERATSKDFERVYDVNALFAHELGHTLFIEHAKPAGESTWRHVEDYNCLMNYDASNSSFCALCLLSLRGWDLGKKSAPKFPLKAGAPITIAPPAPIEENPAPPAEVLPSLPPEWDGSVTYFLKEQNVAPEIAAGGDLSSWKTRVSVLSQSSSGKYNTCGFHSLKNALYLLQLAKDIPAQASDERRKSKVVEFKAGAIEPPGASERFVEVFRGAGSEDAPANQSWLKIARTKGGMREGNDSSIDTGHHLDLLEKIKAGAATVPRGTSKILASEVIRGLEFAAEQYLVGGDEMVAVIKAFKELRESAHPIRRAFLMASGAHFVAVLVNRYEGWEELETEIILADSQNASLSAYNDSLSAIEAWLDAEDLSLLLKTFDVAHYDTIKHVLLHDDDQRRPTLPLSDNWIPQFEAAIRFLEGAGCLADPLFKPRVDVLRRWLQGPANTAPSAGCTLLLRKLPRAT